jgi:hypothetical protein
MIDATLRSLSEQAVGGPEKLGLRAPLHVGDQSEDEMLGPGFGEGGHVLGDLACRAGQGEA